MTALLERDAELLAIDGALTAARQGRGEGLLLEGPAGIGKTSLLGAAQERAAAARIGVLRASGDDLEREFPWGVAVQLFGAVAQEDPGDLFDGAAGLVRPLLEHGPGEEVAADLHPILHGFHWLTNSLAERAPLLVVVDDAQLADPQSLRLVHYLLRRIEALPVSLMLAVRQGEPADTVTRELIERIRADPTVETRSLAPLEDSSIRAMARHRLPGADEAFCDALIGAVGGNPFLCRELLGAVGEEGIEPDADGAARVSGLRPEGVRNSILVRLGRMGPATARLAAAVAVLGPAATLPLAAELADLDPGAADAAADRLATAEMIEIDSALRFVHPIVREVVYDDLPPAGRRREHRSAARLLRERGAAAEAVASHLLRADPVGEDWAAATLREAAAEDLRRGAAGRAAQLLRAALADPAAAAERAAVLIELGRAEARAGEPGATERFREALRLLEPGAEAAEASLALAETLYAWGHFPAAAEAAERGVELLEALPAAERDPVLEARMLAPLDTRGQSTGRHPERIRERTRALLREPASSPSPADRVLMAIAAYEHAIGGELPRDRVVELARAALAGEDAADAMGRVPAELVIVSLVFSDRYAEANETLDLLLERARQRGEAAIYTNLVTLRALSAAASGPLTAAVAGAEDAIRLAAEAPESPPPTLAAAHYVLVSASLDRGERGRAEAAAEPPPGFASLEDSPLFGWLLAARGRIAAANDRPGEALEAFLAAGRRFAAGRDSLGPFCDWQSGAALAARACGEREKADALAAQALVVARRFDSPRAICAALRTQALLAEGERTIELLREAEASAERSEAAVERARTRVELGAALRRAGHRRDSRQPLREALEEARRIGARAVAERAATELKASGVRRPRLALGGVESLTPSELRVAEMAAGGMGNRQIAEALFVTRKTVEVHLSNTYRKLEIGSRGELPAALSAPGEE